MTAISSFSAGVFAEHTNLSSPGPSSTSAYGGHTVEPMSCLGWFTVRQPGRGQLREATPGAHSTARHRERQEKMDHGGRVARPEVEKEAEKDNGKVEVVLKQSFAQLSKSISSPKGLESVEFGTCCRFHDGLIDGTSTPKNQI